MIRNYGKLTFELSTGLFLLALAAILVFYPQCVFAQDSLAADNPPAETELRDDLKMRLSNAEYKIKRLTDQVESMHNKMERLQGKVERLQRLENITSRIDSLDRKIESVESLASRIERNQN